MSLFPEQQQALDYLRGRGSEAPLAEIRSRIERTFSEIEALAAAVPAALARRRPAPASWAVQEVVDHLVESERPAIRELARLLAGESVEGPPIPASQQSAEALDADWRELLGRFRATHQALLRLLDEASDDIPLAATAPVQMVVKCARPDGSLEPVSWVERLDWKAYALVLHAHGRQHIDQVRRILASLSSREEGAGAPPAATT